MQSDEAMFSGFLKMQDVREAVRGKGVDPKIMYIMEKLAEQDRMLKEMISRVAMQNDELVTHLMSLIGVMDVMGSSVDEIKKVLGPDGMVQSEAIIPDDGAKR